MAISSRHVPLPPKPDYSVPGMLEHWETGPRINLLDDQAQAVPEVDRRIKRMHQAWSVVGREVEVCGPVTVLAKVSREERCAWLHAGVREYMPGAWVSKITVLAKAAMSGHVGYMREQAAGDVYADWLKRYAGADGADLSEAAIRERAEAIAKRADAASFIADKNGFAWTAWGRLCEFVERYGGCIKPTRKIVTLASWAARARCPKWWRRQLRRWVTQQFETGAIELGLVGAKAGQWYCSDRAVKRRAYQNAANEAAMRATVIESGSGQSMSVWDAAQLTVSNKTIRRGELMTRIKGCELWADSEGLLGLFTTHTLPSRFHRSLKGGGLNKKWDGSSPADGQAWLRLQWSRLRAKLAREGWPIMGLRVVEPHHDATPHWHMLLWCRPEHAECIKLAIWLHWLPVDEGDDWCEPGALEQRTNVKAMLPGMATGYVAKYIAKNIDDAHVDAHNDGDEVPGMTVGPDLLGDLEIKPSQRVEAWASTWRIRQFQAIGQPSVTVWRELRRVTEQAVGAASDGMILAWLAVHRKGEKQADWCAYMRAQGGAMLPRKEYRFCPHTLDREKMGRYEVVREKWACGVADRASVSHLNVSPTKRERWGAEGFAARSASPPWTRLNNCTRHNSRQLGRATGSVAELRLAGLLDTEDGYTGWEVDEVVIKTPWIDCEAPW